MKGNDLVQPLSFFFTAVGLGSAFLMAIDVINFTLPAALLVIALMFAGLWMQGANK